MSRKKASLFLWAGIARTKKRPVKCSQIAQMVKVNTCGAERCLQAMSGCIEAVAAKY